MHARVLVADDSVTIRKFVALALEGEPVEVLSAADGLEALETVEALRPDVVLADLTMPGLGGLELCERIRQSPRLHDTGILLLVGMFESFDQAEARRVEADGHLSKPIDPAELLRAVRDLLQRRRPVAETVAGAPPGRSLTVSARARTSFTGSNRILDIVAPALQRVQRAPAPGAAAGPGGAEDALASRVEEAVRRLAPAIVREIAEQVVPAIARKSAP